ncbi:MAG: MFS transporter [Roseicyclus sp.]
MNFVIGMGAFLVVGTIEPMASDLDVTAGQTGALMTTYALVYAVCSPLLVSLTGGIGRRRVLAAGLTIFGLAALASALAPTLGSLHAARAMAAVGAGVVTPVSAAVAAMLVPPERRARTLAQVFLGLTIAQAVGIPIGGWLAYTVGWRYAFTLVALIAIPALVLLWRIVPAGLSFRPVALSDLGRTLSDLPVMSAVLFTMSFMAGIFALYTYFAPLLTAQMGFGRDGVSLLLLIFGLGAIAGNRMGGVLADRFGPSRTLMALTVVQIVFLSMYSALPFPVWVLGAVTFICRSSAGRSAPPSRCA